MCNSCIISRSCFSPLPLSHSYWRENGNQLKKAAWNLRWYLLIDNAEPPKEPGCKESLMKQCHLISSDLSGWVWTIMWERSKLLDYLNSFVMYLFVTVWLVPKLMPSWRLFLKATYCCLCIHKLWFSEFQGLIHHQEAKSITMISLFQSIEKLLWLAFILLRVGSIKELSLLTLL